jgi:uncharacterized protein YdeI (YjbR/CyaY-like superfamily)
MAEAARYFENSRQWRGWLEQNHDREPEAWLLFYKKASGKPSMTVAEATEAALCYGWIDGKLQSLGAESFRLRYTPRQPGSLWSRINKDKAERLMAEGRMAPAGLAAVEAAKKNGRWAAAYSSRRQEKMPDDLAAALAGDETARANFSGFANSYRNTYIGWVNDAKTAPTRQRRIAEVVRRAALNKKPGID